MIKGDYFLSYESDCEVFELYELSDFDVPVLGWCDKRRVLLTPAVLHSFNQYILKSNKISREKACKISVFEDLYEDFSEAYINRHTQDEYVALWESIYFQVEELKTTFNRFLNSQRVKIAYRKVKGKRVVVEKIASKPQYIINLPFFNIHVDASVCSSKVIFKDSRRSHLSLDDIALLNDYTEKTRGDDAHLKRFKNKIKSAYVSVKILKGSKYNKISHRNFWIDFCSDMGDYSINFARFHDWKRKRQDKIS